MGFKRTTEGRVFFTGSAAEASNDSPLGKRLDEREDLPLTSGHSSQLQMLSLLKSLNEKLKFMQVERKSMRQEIESYQHLVRSLEAKSEVTRKDVRGLKEAVKSTQDEKALEALRVEISAQIAQTRKALDKVEGRAEKADRSVSDILGQADKHKQVTVALSKKQSELGRLYQKLAEQMEEETHDYKDLLAKVEAFDSKQAAIEERFDAETKDRERFVRQIERIEAHIAAFREETLQLSARADDLVAEQGQGDHKPVFISSAKETKAQYSHVLKDYLQKAQAVLAGLKQSSAVKGGALAVFVALVGVAAWNYGGALRPADSGQVVLEMPQVNLSQQADAPRVRAAQDWAQSRDASTFDITEQMQASQNTDEPLANEEAISAADMASAAVKMADMEPGVNEVVAGNIPAPSKQAALPEAVAHLQSMAESGNAEAQHDLAAFYIVGAQGVPKDYSKAAYWFDKAAQGGVVNAAYNLGVLYHQGLGVPQDIERAMQWYKIAADGGHAEAQYNLGIAYIEGIGVEYNPAAATLHFERAAKNGVIEAAYNLGLIYENGLLGAADPAEALMWYKAAADAGNMEAQSALEQLAGSLGVSVDQINKAVPDFNAPDLGAALTPAKTSANMSAQAGNTAASGASSASLSSFGGAVTTSRSLVRSVQEYLAIAGFYSGMVDGIYGPGTERAIRSYQKAENIVIDGEPSQTLLDYMRAHSS